MTIKYLPMSVSTDYLRWSSSTTLSHFFNRLPVVPNPHRIVYYKSITADMVQPTHHARVTDVRREAILGSMDVEAFYFWDRLAWFDMEEGEKLRFEMWDASFGDIGRHPRYLPVRMECFKAFSHGKERSHFVNIEWGDEVYTCHMTRGRTTDHMFLDWFRSYNEVFTSVYNCEVIRL